MQVEGSTVFDSNGSKSLMYVFAANGSKDALLQTGSVASDVRPQRFRTRTLESNKTGTVDKVTKARWARKTDLLNDPSSPCLECEARAGVC